MIKEVRNEEKAKAADAVKQAIKDTKNQSLDTKDCK